MTGQRLKEVTLKIDRDTLRILEEFSSTYDKTLSDLLSTTAEKIVLVDMVRDALNYFEKNSSLFELADLPDRDCLRGLANSWVAIRQNSIQKSIEREKRLDELFDRMML